MPGGVADAGGDGGGGEAIVRCLEGMERRKEEGGGKTKGRRGEERGGEGEVLPGSSVEVGISPMGNSLDVF